MCVAYVVLMRLCRASDGMRVMRGIFAESLAGEGGDG